MFDCRKASFQGGMWLVIAGDHVHCGAVVLTVLYLQSWFQCRLFYPCCLENLRYLGNSLQVDILPCSGVTVNVGPCVSFHIQNLYRCTYMGHDKNSIDRLFLCLKLINLSVFMKKFMYA
jgi:hypothetical protein